MAPKFLPEVELLRSRTDRKGPESARSGRWHGGLDRQELPDCVEKLLSRIESEILIRQRLGIRNKRLNLIGVRNNNTRIGSLLSGHRLFQHNLPTTDSCTAANAGSRIETRVTSRLPRRSVPAALPHTARTLGRRMDQPLPRQRDEFERRRDGLHLRRGNGSIGLRMRCVASVAS